MERTGVLCAGGRVVFGPKRGGGSDTAATARAKNPEDLTPRATGQTQKDGY